MVFAEHIIRILSDSASIIGTLLGAIAGSFLGAYLQRRFEHSAELRRQVYQPLFNEVDQVAGGDLPYHISRGSYEPFWIDLDEYYKFEINDDIEANVDEYSDKLLRLNKLESELRQHLLDMDYSIFAYHFPDHLITEVTTEGDLGFDLNQSNSAGLLIEDFIINYYHPILAADDPEELEDLLHEWAEERGLGGGLLAYWSVERPEWNEELFEIFRDRVEQFESGEKYSEYRDLRQDIINDAERLRNQLESKVSGVI